ncbi:hypothetical protein Gotur_011918 [Gossypium turneri]
MVSMAKLCLGMVYEPSYTFSDLLIASLDITFLTFGTSFPQISLATIDAIRNIENLYAGGLGSGTLLGLATFDLFPIHAICVVVPKARELKKISNIGVWLVELFWSFSAYAWLYIILEV